MTFDEWTTFINDIKVVATYFSGKSCGVCHVLKPKVLALLENKFPEIRFLSIEAEQSPQLCGQLSVFTIPTLIITIEGKESFRFSRNFSLAEVEGKLQRPYTLFYN